MWSVSVFSVFSGGEVSNSSKLSSYAVRFAEAFEPELVVAFLECRRDIFVAVGQRCPAGLLVLL